MRGKYRRIYRISRTKLEEAALNLAKKRGIEDDIKFTDDAIELHYKNKRYLKAEKPIAGHLNIIQDCLQRDIIERNPEFLAIELGREFRRAYPWLRIHIEMP